MSQYLEFALIHDTGKTKVISVDSKSSGARLAVIKWYGPWRQYVLEPESDTIWNRDCLEDVNAQMKALLAERRIPA